MLIALLVKLVFVYGSFKTTCTMLSLSKHVFSVCSRAASLLNGNPGSYVVMSSIPCGGYTHLYF